MSRIALLLLGAVASAPMAHAQSVDDAARLEKIEKDLRVLQRKVFPKGAPTYLEPETQAAQPQGAKPQTQPDTSALVAMQGRLDALDARLQSMTGQLEQANFRLRQLEDGLTRFKSDAEFRLNALETGKPAGPATADAAVAAPAQTANTDAAAAAGPKKTGDAVETAYLEAYGFVEAKDYPRAEQALAGFVKANPASRRASYAQYWLGRVYMVQKKHDEAALAFAEGYEKFPKGERAPDTLLWLGKSLVARGQPELACRSLGELDVAYKAIARGRLANDLKATRTDAKCG